MRMYLQQQNVPSATGCTFSNRMYLQIHENVPSATECTFSNRMYLQQQNVPSGTWECTFSNRMYLQIHENVPSATECTFSNRMYLQQQNVPSVHSVAFLSHYKTFKYRWIIRNIYNTFENSHILSTHKLTLAAEYTEDYEIHRYNPLYYKRTSAWYVLPEGGTVMPKYDGGKLL